MNKIIYEPIGVIHTPFKTRENMPVQPSGGKDIEGLVEVDTRYQEGLNDLEGFSHVYLVYHLHRSQGYSLKVVPFLDTVKRGLFATRAPRRPNPIGISIVRLKHISGNKLYFCDVDILDGTPLLDIKPCVPEFDTVGDLRIGWLEGRSKHVEKHKSDNRFASEAGET